MKKKENKDEEDFKPFEAFGLLSVVIFLVLLGKESLLWVTDWCRPEHFTSSHCRAGGSIRFLSSLFFPWIIPYLGPALLVAVVCFLLAEIEKRGFANFKAVLREKWQIVLWIGVLVLTFWVSVSMEGVTDWVRVIFFQGGF